MLFIKQKLFEFKNILEIQVLILVSNNITYWGQVTVPPTSPNKSFPPEKYPIFKESGKHY